MMRPFDHWPEIASRARSADSIALFLDFDGTLARLRPTPGEVHLSPLMRRAINRLAAHRHAHVWIISGRRLDDVRERARLSHVHFLGVHGWESGRETALDSHTQRELDRAKRRLANYISNLHGVWIEDKGSAFAIHYREAGEDESSLARASMNEVLAQLNGGFRLFSGKKVWEILPCELGDKGSAVRLELSRFQHRPLAVYLGDDFTDERAFAALPDGITIRVGPHALTRARFQLRDPGEVRRFLEQLEAELSASKATNTSANNSWSPEV